MKKGSVIFRVTVLLNGEDAISERKIQVKKVGCFAE